MGFKEKICIPGAKGSFKEKTGPGLLKDGKGFWPMVTKREEGPNSVVQYILVHYVRQIKTIPIYGNLSSQNICNLSMYSVETNIQTPSLKV
jgi:hypothetical protein